MFRSLGQRSSILTATSTTRTPRKCFEDRETLLDDGRTGQDFGEEQFEVDFGNGGSGVVDDGRTTSGKAIVYSYRILGGLDVKFRFAGNFIEVELGQIGGHESHGHRRVVRDRTEDRARIVEGCRRVGIDGGTRSGGGFSGRGFTAGIVSGFLHGGREGNVPRRETFYLKFIQLERG